MGLLRQGETPSGAEGSSLSSQRSTHQYENHKEELASPPSHTMHSALSNLQARSDACTKASAAQQLRAFCLQRRDPCARGGAAQRPRMQRRCRAPHVGLDCRAPHLEDAVFRARDVEIQELASSLHNGDVLGPTLVVALVLACLHQVVQEWLSQGSVADCEVGSSFSCLVAGRLEQVLEGWRREAWMAHRKFHSPAVEPEAVATRGL
mmetsp:Transcript_10828/g.37941  ORF Transcript_10828/g.37941 Transcript_10828/m.37941 type:complete len:207 (-) Transcript_10828:635-1255(-)